MIGEESGKWIDVSVPIENGMVHWPNEIPVEIKKLSSIENGDIANVTILSMSVHTATHIDAPLHFFKNGKDIAALPVDVMMGPAKVIEIRDKHSINLNEIENISLKKGDRVLFKTHNSDKNWAMQGFLQDYVFLSTEAALYLKEREIAVIGVDYLSVAGLNNGAEVHRILLGAEIVIIEGLNLKNIEQGDYEMICLPIKIKGADGAPSRVLIKKQITK